MLELLRIRPHKREDIEFFFCKIKEDCLSKYNISDKNLKRNFFEVDFCGFDPYTGEMTETGGWCERNDMEDDIFEEKSYCIQEEDLVIFSDEDLLAYKKENPYLS